MMNNLKNKEIEIVVPCGLVTSKSVAWGGLARELHLASLEAIRHAVRTSSDSEVLRSWLECRTKLSLDVEFQLAAKRVANTDLDSLLSDLLNPLVEGACGPRPAGKPIPQTKDALFWHVSMRKARNEDEKIILRIRELTDLEPA